jgi:hypothetical protein
MNLIPDPAAVLRNRITQVLYSSPRFPVRVDLSLMPAAVRDSVMDDLRAAGYTAVWNQSSSSLSPVEFVNQWLSGTLLREDYWVIYPTPEEGSRDQPA